MATNSSSSAAVHRMPPDASTAADQAYQALRLAFTVAPIVAGLDKFLGWMADWTKYLWPPLADMAGLAPGVLMRGVGAVEIAAGIIVAVRPRLGGYVVAAWLGGIMVNLMLVGGFWDIILRDLGLAIGAFALARLASADRS